MGIITLSDGSRIDTGHLKGGTVTVGGTKVTGTPQGAVITGGGGGSRTISRTSKPVVVEKSGAIRPETITEKSIRRIEQSDPRLAVALRQHFTRKTISTSQKNRFAKNIFEKKGYEFAEKNGVLVAVKDGEKVFVKDKDFAILKGSVSRVSDISPGHLMALRKKEIAEVKLKRKKEAKKEAEKLKAEAKKVALETNLTTPPKITNVKQLLSAINKKQIFLVGQKGQILRPDSAVFSYLIDKMKRNTFKKNEFAGMISKLTLRQKLKLKEQAFTGKQTAFFNYIRKTLKLPKSENVSLFKDGLKAYAINLSKDLLNSPIDITQGFSDIGKKLPRRFIEGVIIATPTGLAKNPDLAMDLGKGVKNIPSGAVDFVKSLNPATSKGASNIIQFILLNKLLKGKSNVKTKSSLSKGNLVRKGTVSIGTKKASFIQTAKITTKNIRDLFKKKKVTVKSNTKIKVLKNGRVITKSVPSRIAIKINNNKFIQQIKKFHKKEIKKTITPNVKRMFPKKIKPNTQKFIKIGSKKITQKDLLKLARKKPLKQIQAERIISKKWRKKVSKKGKVIVKPKKTLKSIAAKKLRQSERLKQKKMIKAQRAGFHLRNIKGKNYLTWKFKGKLYNTRKEWLQAIKKAHNKKALLKEQRRIKKQIQNKIKFEDLRASERVIRDLKLKRIPKAIRKGSKFEKINNKFIQVWSYNTEKFFSRSEWLQAIKQTLKGLEKVRKIKGIKKKSIPSLPSRDYLNKNIDKIISVTKNKVKRKVNIFGDPIKLSKIERKKIFGPVLSSEHKKIIKKVSDNTKKIKLAAKNNNKQQLVLLQKTKIDSKKISLNIKKQKKSTQKTIIKTKKKYVDQKLKKRVIPQQKGKLKVIKPFNLAKLLKDIIKYSTILGALEITEKQNQKILNKFNQIKKVGIKQTPISKTKIKTFPITKIKPSIKTKLLPLQIPKTLQAQKTGALSVSSLLVGSGVLINKYFNPLKTTKKRGSTAPQNVYDFVNRSFNRSIKSKRFVYLPDLAAIISGETVKTISKKADLLAVGRVFTGLERRGII